MSSRPKPAGARHKESGAPVRRSGPLARSAWLPIPLLLAAVLALWVGNFETPHESVDLLLVLSLIFLTSTSASIAYLVGRSFLAQSRPGLLLLGCGVVVWGTAGSAGAIAGLPTVAGRLDINVLVAIHNIGAWLSGLCHLAGVSLLLRSRRGVGAAALWLVVGYALAFSVVLLVARAAHLGAIPAFFVQGQGGTPLREATLASAVAMFAVTALLLQLLDRQTASQFAHWYSLALGLIAVGLCGVALQTTAGSPLNWVARAAQYLGGVYMLVAAAASARETRAWQLPLEAALQQERDFNAAVLSTVGALVVVLDVEGRVIRFNRACEALTGYTAAEVMGKRVWEFLLLPEERGAVMETFGRLQFERLPNEHENHWVAKDGSRRLIHWSNTVLVDAAGQVEHVIGTGLDVTDQRRAELAAQQAHELLNRHVDNSPLATVEWDGEFRITRWAGEAERVFGWTAEEAVGKRLDELPWVYEEDAASVSAVMADMVSGARPSNVNRNRNVRKDGRVIHCEWYNTALHDAEGRLVSVLSQVLDVTDRKRAEEEREQANRRVNQILESIQDDFYVLSRDWVFVYASRQFTARIGKEPEDFLGNNFWEMFPQHLGTVLEESFRAAMEQREVRRFETPGRYTNAWYRMTAFPSPEGITVLGTDISEQREAQEARLEAERARTRLAQTLTSEIAHRTKNNLAIVASLLQLQLDQDEQPDAHADLIREAVTRIMSFSVLQEQMYQRRSETVEVLDALRRIAVVDRQALSTGGVEITVEGDPVEYPAGIATNLCVVANELITNALKHGAREERGRRIEVRVGRREGKLLLSVWGSHNSLPAGAEIRGNGVGLGLVRALIEEQYGGVFSLKAEGGGSLARVTIDEERLRVG